METTNSKVKFFSLKKSRKIFKTTCHIYKRKKKNLRKEDAEKIETLLKMLHSSLLQKDREAASKTAQILEDLSSKVMPKNWLDHTIDFAAAVLFAFIIALFVRQMWFELNYIPSGSMRPTLKEKDLLLVSKTDFGINTVGRTSHLYFDPTQVKRGAITIFSVENLDVADPKTTYFLLFPGIKQFVKRLIAKPGDIIYFYGGKLYGIDAQGNEIKEFRKMPWFTKIEHIPFIRFEGKVITPPSPGSGGIFSPVIINQMNEPVAKLNLDTSGKLTGEILGQNDHLAFGDIWGFKNFAMARILTKEEVQNYSEAPQPRDNAEYYLELIHHPSFDHLKLVKDEYGRIRPALSYETSLLPLSTEKMRKIFAHLTTSRFCIENKRANRYSYSSGKNPYAPVIAAPDGCYEFENGEGYEVIMQNITKKLSPLHPLSKFSKENTKLLFNLGIEFDTRYSPKVKNQVLLPSRYAYFRNGALYLLGHPIFDKHDEELIKFLDHEYKRQSGSPLSKNYQPFEDLGAPIKNNGQIDANFIKKYGLKIPDKMYLLLGDNHAASADCRDFGFVPQANLRGCASFLFWPPGDRFGLPLQPKKNIINLSKMVIWSSALILTVGYFIYIRVRNKRMPKL